MNWIEWKNSLINLRHVKSIYYVREGWEAKETWTLNVLMHDKEGKYVRHFESEEEVKREYERIKSEMHKDLDVILEER